MAFWREKKVGNHTYIYEVENRRVEGKVKQIILNYLGPAIPLFGRFFRAPYGWARRRNAPRLPRWGAQTPRFFPLGMDGTIAVSVPFRPSIATELRDALQLERRIIATK